MTSRVQRASQAGLITTDTSAFARTIFQRGSARESTSQHPDVTQPIASTAYDSKGNLDIGTGTPRTLPNTMAYTSPASDMQSGTVVLKALQPENRQHFSTHPLPWNSSINTTGSPHDNVPGYLNTLNETFDDDLPFELYNNFSICASWNSSDCWAVNGTSESYSSDPLGPSRFWALLLLVFPLMTIFGNILVIMSVYREKSLQSVTNYFIVSLAIADIMVGLLVMPFAVYVEVNLGDWFLGDILCDAWVAVDVMSCTASILNLTAISVDRFIAVTQPIRYAKHKNSKRGLVMLGLTWIVSTAIASPIALGLNYTPDRMSTPNLCIFYNSAYIVCSSMGSFYIPCVIMIILYWRIFQAIHARAKKNAMKMASKAVENRNYRDVIENKNLKPAEQHANHESAKQLLPHGSNEAAFVNMATTTTDTGDEDGPDTLKVPLNGDHEHVIPNDKSTEFMLSPVSEDSPGEPGYCAPTTVEVETQFTTVSPTSPKGLLAPSPRKGPLAFKNHFAAKMKRHHNQNDEGSPRKSVTKFNFHLRHSNKQHKKKHNIANKREKKATTTLAIVLGVFLLCWFPFFTANNIHAICMKLKLMHRRECNLDAGVMSFFVWLGYINSSLNPIIYTIFNMEFRRAFKRIIEKPCN